MKERKESRGGRKVCERERTYGDEVCGERKRAEQRKGEEKMGGWEKVSRRNEAPTQRNDEDEDEDDGDSLLGKTFFPGILLDSSCSPQVPRQKGRS